LTYISQSDRSSKGVDKPSTAGGELEDAHALCTHIVGEDFAGIDRLHGRKCQGKDEAEHVDESDGSRGGSLASGAHVVGRGACGDGQAGRHAEGDAKEHLAATDDVVEAGTDHGGDPAADGVDDVQEELGVCAGDADVGYEVG